MSHLDATSSVPVSIAGLTGELHIGPWTWAVFGGVVAVSLVVDLALHRGERELTRRGAIGWTCAWIVLALLFAAWIWVRFGSSVAWVFVTAYLVEKSLSVDNLFVFLVIFSRLNIPRGDQHRVLFWGILGAFVTRAAFIAVGAVVLASWHFATYLLGAFLVFTGIKTFRTDPAEESKEGAVLDLLERHVPYTNRLRGHKFFVIENGRRLATPLFMALIAIEATDVMFALDSIPAVFAISREPFIVFSSNVFAILGLRALYLVIADLVADLDYLHYGLGVLLAYVGVKMIASHHIEIPYWLSLGITVSILTAAIIPSLIVRRRRKKSQMAEGDEPLST